MVLTQCVTTFWTKNKPDLIRICHHEGTHASADIEDICQLFFVKLIEQDCLSKYNPVRGSFSAYIYKILVHCIIDYHKARPKGTEDGLKYIPMSIDYLEFIDKVKDFKRWVKRNAGKQAPNMLLSINKRLLGFELDESYRSTYYRYLNRYLNENLP